jgi:hypothetical protein
MTFVSQLVIELFFFSFQTALSIFFQDAALPTCPPGASAHFGQVCAFIVTNENVSFVQCGNYWNKFSNFKTNDVCRKR